MEVNGVSVDLRYANINGIRVRFAEAGPKAGPLLLFCHGWPESWYLPSLSLSLSLSHTHTNTDTDSLSHTHTNTRTHARTHSRARARIRTGIHGAIRSLHVPRRGFMLLHRT